MRVYMTINERTFRRSLREQKFGRNGLTVSALRAGDGPAGSGGDLRGGRADQSRLRDEVGDIRLVPPEDRVSGPGASVIMAAFTHLNPSGSRFSDGACGVFHAANDLDTAIAETRHHRERFMRATGQPRMELDMRVYLVDLEGELHDLRGQTTVQPLVYHTDNYAAGSIWGERCARPGPTASPMTAFAGPGANAPPSSGRPCFRTPGRSGISAMSGTVGESRPSTRNGNWTTIGYPEFDGDALADGDYKLSIARNG